MRATASNARPIARPWRSSTTISETPDCGTRSRASSRRRERQTLAENARTFALLNLALNDLTIALVETKYHYHFWRPETAIPAGGTDGNEHTEPDASYVPLIETPCHPSYGSGHAATSGAAREVLERAFGLAVTGSS